MRVSFVTANFPPEACGGTEQVGHAQLAEDPTMTTANAVLSAPL